MLPDFCDKDLTMVENKNPQIRPIKPEDNEAVAGVIRDVMTEFGCSGEGYSINDAEVDSMYQAYDNDRSVFYVVEMDGRVLGCGGIAPLDGSDDPEVCELRKMYFRDELRGLGMGRQLMELCLKDAKRLGFRKCYIETVERMEAAGALYRKFGFQRLGSAMGCTGHTTCDVHMVRDLDSSTI